ncbi:MAG: M1 family metallopeptidase [Deltaproteobacteria bacterium]|nr:M1 family metallopeptidase [Deltaproteobacteria bacterium]
MRIDPHSYTDDRHAHVRSLAWEARVDFPTRTLLATATLHFDEPSSGALDLDTRALHITRVTDDRGAAVPFELHAAEDILGSRLSLSLPDSTRSVSIEYRTAPDASALQWLDPAQTAGGKHPYLFSQCQAIHARSVVPLQDTPQRRITFTAALTVPSPLRGLMAAAFDGREERGDVAVERWHMPQPIAPYLFAFAVGELASRELGARSRVWAEPSVVDGAAWEFAEVDGMLAAGESLFGPYAWDRFDILVMPPSFPYGGMENPRLTFVTPTLLAGDRSQVRVIAHELAHAWSGNLVTNAHAGHFWLNEGWTRYAELRMVEVLEGQDTAALVAAICRKDLDETVARFIAEGQGGLTRLRTHLEGVDPDEAFSVVPYDKGELFLRAIETAVGRERFDRFARRYLETFRFGAVTTEAFLDFTERELPGVLASVDAPRWVDGEGMPDNAPTARSARLDAVIAMGDALPAADTRLSTTEWNLWLERLPRPQPAAFCASLDERFGFTSTGNMEVKVAWLRLALASAYDPVLPEVSRVLGAVGRMKYLVPLYSALLARPETQGLARETFERNAAGYHPIARAVVRGRIERAST